MPARRFHSEFVTGSLPDWIRVGLAAGRETTVTTTRGTLSLFVVAAMLSWACTSGDDPPEPTSAGTEPTESAPASPASSMTSIATPEPTVGRGVDNENGLITLGVVAASEEGMAGHRAYWSSVNDELGGVGSTYRVELQQLATIDEAESAEILAVSLDEGPLQPGPPGFFAIAPLQSIDAVAVGRVLDATRPSFGALVAAASSLAASPEFHAAGELGVVAGERCPFDPMTYQLAGGAGSPFVLVCGTPEEVPDLISGIEGVVLLTADAWHPSLSDSLPDGAVVLGALPPPGPDAPAVEVLARVAGDGPWDPAFLRGYTAALTTHLALERGFADGALTRGALVDAAGSLGDADLGFGAAGTVTVSTPDASSPTGLATTDRVQVDS